MRLSTHLAAPGRAGRRPVVAAGLVAGALGLVAYAAQSVIGTRGSALDRVAEDWLFNGLFLLAALLCGLRAAWVRTERGAWTAVAAGLASWGAGGVLFTVDPATVTAHDFPTVADVLWLGFYPGVFVGLGLLVRSRTRQFFASLWLDGAVGALAVAAVAAQWVLPAIVDGIGGSVTTVVADLVYPLADVLLAGFVVCVLAVTGWRPGRVLGLVAVAVGVGALADGLSLSWSATGHASPAGFDVLWPASAVALGLAAWLPSRPAPVVSLEGKRLLVVPVGFAAVAVGLLVLHDVRSLHNGAYLLAVATVVGVVARMAMTFMENLTLVRRSREESLTDPLTGLGNRRRLLLDLDDIVRSASAATPRGLLLFDLNGFKRYNDTFGHPVGDALLARLGSKLATAVAPHGEAYRLGGDEFCVLARLDAVELSLLSHTAVSALSERGQGFDITTACGSVSLPEEADLGSLALQIADERLYADKGVNRRGGFDSEHARDMLLQLLQEREPELHEHLSEVALLARGLGRHLGLAGDELDVVVRAAELHDVGKVAVPDAILHKADGLDAGERAVIERHTEVGERILAVAPALRPVARLVRASHEHFDGTGYPDRLAGDEIPLGARVVAVCDAYHAMTSDRPYRRHTDRASALRELRRHAGTQFDPDVVRAFATVLESVPADHPDRSPAEEAA